MGHAFLRAVAVFPVVPAAVVLAGGVVSDAAAAHVHGTVAGDVHAAAVFVGIATLDGAVAADAAACEIESALVNQVDAASVARLIAADGAAAVQGAVARKGERRHVRQRALRHHVEDADCRIFGHDGLAVHVDDGTIANLDFPVCAGDSDVVCQVKSVIVVLLICQIVAQIALTADIF